MPSSALPTRVTVTALNGPKPLFDLVVGGKISTVLLSSQSIEILSEFCRRVAVAVS